MPARSAKRRTERAALRKIDFVDQVQTDTLRGTARGINGNYTLNAIALSMTRHSVLRAGASKLHGLCRRGEDDLSQARQPYSHLTVSPIGP